MFLKFLDPKPKRVLHTVAGTDENSKYFIQPSFTYIDLKIMLAEVNIPFQNSKRFRGKVIKVVFEE